MHQSRLLCLQAEVSYIEAEACAAALQKYGQEVVPPLEPSPPEVGEAGVREAPSTVEQLQHLFCEVRTGQVPRSHVTRIGISNWNEVTLKSSSRSMLNLVSL